jgi:predicted HicB family RNase H-like nuclease
MVRPRKDPARALSAIVYVRLTEAQKAALELEAAQEQLSLSDITRRVIAEHIQARYGTRREAVAV